MGHKFSKPTQDELRDLWIKKFPETVFCRNQFYRYDKGIYRGIDDMQVKQEIIDVLIGEKTAGISPTSHLATSVMDLVKHKIRIENDKLDGNPNLFVFKNGVLNLRSRKLLDHSPKHFVSLMQNYNYDPDAECPNFNKLLSRLDAETVGFLQEYAGYCLTTDTKRETSVWLYGPPGCGKSSFLEGLQSVMGPYMKFLPPNSLMGERFGMIHVVGARLLYSTEMHLGNINGNVTFNALVSGEEVLIEHKGKDAYPYRSKAKIILAMNTLPEINSRNDGIVRRTQIVGFPALESSERDPNFKERIKREAPGIFNWALAGRERLNKRKYFKIPEASKKLKEELLMDPMNYMQPTTILEQFISEKCALGVQNSAQASIFNEAVRSYCREIGVKTLCDVDISSGMNQLGYEKKKRKGSLFYLGILLIEQ